MKVCDLVQFYGDYGGGWKRYLDDKSRYLSQHAGLSHLVVLPSAERRVADEEGRRVYELPSLRLPWSHSYRMLLHRRAVLRILDQERPDVIEVGDPYRTAWVGLEAGRRLGVPVVAFYHSDFPRAIGRSAARFLGPLAARWLDPPIRRYLVKLYNQMDAVIVGNPRFSRILADCGIRRIVTVPLGVDPLRFRPSAAGAGVCRELGIGERERLLLYAGRLGREKRIRNLLEMIELLDERFHLLVVGEGELGDEVRTVAGSGRVHWRPYTDSTEELCAYYSAADLFVHAGVSETLGLCSLEAQACGVRVLAVRGGGVESTLAGEEPLILADSSAATDLVAAVRRIDGLTDGQTREERRRRVIGRFSTDRTYASLVRLYDLLRQGATYEQLPFLDGTPTAEDSAAYPTLLTG